MTRNKIDTVPIREICVIRGSFPGLLDKPALRAPLGCWRELGLMSNCEPRVLVVWKSSGTTHVGRLQFRRNWTTKLA